MSDDVQQQAFDADLDDGLDEGFIDTSEFVADDEYISAGDLDAADGAEMDAADIYIAGGVQKPTVAIIGRPNVGKSTLMNRIVGRRIAIVEQRPGVTRDRKEVDADWMGKEFTLVDTGGWMMDGEELDDKVSRQSEQAFAEADIALFVVDGIAGIMAEDAAVAELLRRREGPTLLVANKIDADVHEAGIWELLSLGMGEPLPVSAVHGRGVADLLDRVAELLPEIPEGTDDVPLEPQPPPAGEPHAVDLAGWPAQCRQVHPVQSPGGRRTVHRP